MMKRVSKTKHKSRQAFTLVELIVVLVILAVVAAMLVPALTGYIKRAKRDKYDEAAHYALVAAQSVIVEYYGKGNIAGNGTANLSGQQGGGGGAGDIRWDTGRNCNNTDAEKEWGEKVLKLIDRDRDSEPYLLIFGTAQANCKSTKATYNVTNSDLYTVYYLAYVDNENAPAVFYLNGEWSYTYPTDGGNKAPVFKDGNVPHPSDPSKKMSVNLMRTPNGNLPLQFYVVSNKTNIPDNFWTSGANSLKGHSEPQFKG